MAYRRFRLPETRIPLATVATIRGEPGPSVANVATVASPEPVFEGAEAESVAIVATVARADAKSEHGVPERAGAAGEAPGRAISAVTPATVATVATVRGERMALAAYRPGLARLSAGC